MASATVHGGAEGPPCVLVRAGGCAQAGECASEAPDLLHPNPNQAHPAPSQPQEVRGFTGAARIKVLVKRQTSRFEKRLVPAACRTPGICWCCLEASVRCVASSIQQFAQAKPASRRPGVPCRWAQAFACAGPHSLELISSKSKHVTTWSSPALCPQPISAGLVPSGSVDSMTD